MVLTRSLLIGGCATGLALALVAPSGNATYESAARTVKIDIPMATDVASSRDGSRVWVVGADDGTINKIADEELKETITTDGDFVMNVWTTPNGKKAFVIDGTRDRLFKADWSSSKLRSRSTKETPIALVGGKSGGRKVLYVLNLNNGVDEPKTVSVFGRPKMKLLDTFRLPRPSINQPQALALSPDGSKLYVGNGRGVRAAVWVLSTQTGKILHRLKSAYPDWTDLMLEVEAIAVAPRGKYLFVGVFGQAATYKLNATTGEIVAMRKAKNQETVTAVSMLGAHRVLALSASPSEGDLPKEGKLQVLRRKNLKPTRKKITVDRLPIGLAASQSGKKLTAHVANNVFGSYWGISIG
ncbi:MAG: hypothetical protein U0904_05735 [Candidatus Nanopelagicales bacterium]|nr:hypothetical protein [Candidatus Nanopelagicales bacterium]